MNQLWYKINGWVLIILLGVSGIVLFALSPYFSLINLCISFFNGCPASLGSNLIFSIQALSTIVSLLILSVFFANGLFYIKLEEEKTNNFTDWSVKLSLAGLIIYFSTTLFFVLWCLPEGGIHSECFAWSGILAIFPIGFAGILYLGSLILLMVNWLRNR